MNQEIMNCSIDGRRLRSSTRCGISSNAGKDLSWSYGEIKKPETSTTALQAGAEAGSARVVSRADKGYEGLWVSTRHEVQGPHLRETCSVEVTLVAGSARAHGHIEWPTGAHIGS